MVFQNYALYPHMTVYENMAFALKLRKTPKAEIDRRVKEAAALLQLEEYLGRKPKALSGGQRQRVAMGRAIVREPQVFLMDEPLSNLDAKLRVQTRTQIASLQAKLGITTVYVTHDQVEAMTMGHRVAVLLDGVLQQVDTPRALYDTPANVFVAGFIGSPAMNIKTVPLTEQGADFAEHARPADPGAGRRGPRRRRRRQGDRRLPPGGLRPGQRRPRAACRSWSSWSRTSARTPTSTATPRSRATTERFVVRTDRRSMPNMGDTVFVKPRDRPAATSSTPPPAPGSDVRDTKGRSASAGRPFRRTGGRPAAPWEPGGKWLCRVIRDGVPGS